MLDLLIRGGSICDGSGAAAFRGDVGVRDGRIVAVGAVAEDARQVIEAAGLTVAPGFIDPHTHYDAQLVWDGLAQPALEHGVTTIAPGNCSLSLAPLRPEHREALGATFRKIEEMPKNAFDAGLAWNWQTFGEYLDTIRPGLGVNIAPLVGHSLLRMWVMGEAASQRTATDDEVARIQAVLAECMEAGASGMSTSWVDIDYQDRPVPARFADAKELDALCATLGRYNGILQVVPEFYDPDLICARIDILADLSRKHGITATFSPLFDSTAMPDLVDITLERVRIQAEHGARVWPQMQTRPIDLAFELSGTTSAFITMPAWYAMTKLPKAEKIVKLADPEFRRQLIAEMSDFRMPIGLQIDFADARVKRMGREDPALMGRRVGDIAREQGRHFAEVMIDIAVSDDFATSFGLENIGHNDARKIGPLLHDPNVRVGAGDGGAHVTVFSTYGDTGYLFSQYVRKDHVLTVEEAVRKLTHELATFWGLKDRGLLKAGYAADIVVFDPETLDRGPEIAVNDLPAEGYRYVRRAVGVDSVIVNGQLAYSRSGGYTSARAGRVAERVVA